jgi:hypothetical protein
MLLNDFGHIWFPLQSMVVYSVAFAHWISRESPVRPGIPERAHRPGKVVPTSFKGSCVTKRRVCHLLRAWRAGRGECLADIGQLDLAQRAPLFSVGRGETLTSRTTCRVAFLSLQTLCRPRNLTVALRVRSRAPRRRGHHHGVVELCSGDQLRRTTLLVGASDRSHVPEALRNQPPAP